MINIALFASGNGSNAEQIMKYFEGHPDIAVVALLSNNQKALALERARRFEIPAISFTREELYNSHVVLKKLMELQVDYIALAGFMWLVPESIVEAFPDRILNIHPALLPKYGGKGMYGINVHRAVYENRERESGISIHLVNREYDRGTIIHQRRCLLDPLDGPEEIAKKVQQLEHLDYPKVIENIIRKSGKNS